MHLSHNKLLMCISSKVQETHLLTGMHVQWSASHSGTDSTNYAITYQVMMCEYAKDILEEVCQFHIN